MWENLSKYVPVVIVPSRRILGQVGVPGFGQIVHCLLKRFVARGKLAHRQGELVVHLLPLALIRQGAGAH